MKTILSDFDFQFAEKNILQRYNIKRRTVEQPITEFCIENGIDINFMNAIISAFENPSAFHTQELNTFSPYTVIEYLQKTHEYYLCTLLPEIEQTFIQLIKNIGISEIAPVKMLEKFISYKLELQEHIQEEEVHFFPYIKELLSGKKRTGAYDVNTFYNNHQHNEELLSELKTMAEKNYLLANEYMSYSVLLTKLNLLENDLKIHALVEEQILAPKALMLENG